MQLFQQLAVLNHYKEKSIKLQIELAKLQRKYDVLNEKYVAYRYYITITPYINSFHYYLLIFQVG